MSIPSMPLNFYRGFSSIDDDEAIEFPTFEQRRFEQRRHAWFTAKNMVEPLIEQHGLKDFRGPAPAFSTGVMVTSVEQHSDLIIETANWLLGLDD